MVTEPVDLAVARHWIGSDRNLMLELVGIFVDEKPTRVGALRAALAARDTAWLERLAHSLTSASGVLGARPLAAASAALEVAARDAQLEGASALVARVEVELGRVVAFFEDPAWQARLDVEAAR